MEMNPFNISHRDRDYTHQVTQEERDVLGRFGPEYYRSPYVHGYQRYEYNGSYTEGAKELVDFYGLEDRARILDVGCACGFLLHDMMMVNGTLQCYGVDISEYALTNAMSTLHGRLMRSSAAALPFNDSSFDLVVSMDVLGAMHWADSRRAVREITRVGRVHKFLQIESYTTDEERRNFINWEPLTNSQRSVDEWKELFREEGYDGDYYWKIFR